MLSSPLGRGWVGSWWHFALALSVGACSGEDARRGESASQQPETPQIRAARSRLVVPIIGPEITPNPPTLGEADHGIEGSLDVARGTSGGLAVWCERSISDG